MKRNPEDRAQTFRTLKVGEAMRHALAALLQRGDLADPVLEKHIVSVSEVRVSPDLRHATAYVMPVGASEADQAAVLEALTRNGRTIRHALARAVNTKYAADIHFRLDETYAEGSRIDALLRNPRVKRDLADPSPPRQPEEE
jgi:ribosome-binding factor A